MKKKSSKKATIVATYRADLSLVLNWLKLLKVIRDLGEITERENGTYSVRVKAKVSKKELDTLVKDRFGVFAKVV